MLKVNNTGNRDKKDQLNDQDLYDFLLLLEEKFHNDTPKLQCFTEVFQNFQDSK